MQTLPVRFEAQPLDLVVTDDGRRAFTAEMVGVALEYDEPSRQINKLHRRHGVEFEQGVDWDWFDPEHSPVMEAERGQTGPTARYATRIYYQTGVNLLGFFSRQPKAKLFRRWAKHVLAGRQAGGAPAVDPAAQALLGMAQQLQAMTQQLIEEAQRRANSPVLPPVAATPLQPVAVEAPPSLAFHLDEGALGRMQRVAEARRCVVTAWSRYRALARRLPDAFINMRRDLAAGRVRDVPVWAAELVGLPSQRTLERWARRYREGGVEALIPRYGLLSARGFGRPGAAGDEPSSEAATP